MAGLSRSAPGRTGVLLLLVGALALAGGGLWWLVGKDHGAIAVPPIQGSTADVPADPAGTRAAPPDSPSRLEAVGDTAALAGPFGTAPRKLRPERPLESGLSARTVDALGNIVPGVEVTVVRRPDRVPPGEWDAYFEGANDLHALFDAFGKLFVSSESGTLFIPRPAGRVWVRMQRGERWSMRELSTVTKEPVDLVIREDRASKVAVQNAAGESMPDVAVALRLRTEDLTRDFWHGVTRPDGTLEIPHIAQQIDRVAPEEGRVVVGFGFPADPATEVRVDRDAPSRPVLLPMPATGRLVVELQDVTGVRFSRDALVSIELQSEGGGRVERSRIPRFTLPVSAGQDKAVFPHVPLHLPLRVRAAATDADYAAVQTILPLGRPDEVRVIALRVGDRTAVVLGTVTDEQGNVLANRVVRLFVDVFAGRKRVPTKAYTVVRETDVGGRFRLALYTELEASERAELRVFLKEDYDHLARVVLPALEPPRDIDLGELRLEPHPVLVSGVVRGPDGGEVAGARVRLQRQVGPHWIDEMLEAVETDADGRFEFRGETPRTGDLRVSVAKAGFRTAESEPFEAGAREVAVALELGGVVRARVLVDEDVPLDLLVPTMTRSDGEEATDPLDLHPRCEVDADGRFGWDDLVPGVYDLAVGLLAEAEPVVAIEKLRVIAGPPLADPRLEAIDLRGKLHVFRLRVTDDKADPVPRANVFFMRAGERPDPRRGRRLEHGVLDIVTRYPAVDVEVYAPDARAALVGNLDRDRDLRLRRPVSVKVRLAEGAQHLPDDCRLFAHLEPVESEDDPLYVVYEDPARASASRRPWKLPEPQPLDDDRQVSLNVPAPGTYRVVWTVERKGPAQMRRAVVRESAATRATFEDASSYLPFDVELDPKELEAAVNETRAR